MSEFLRAALGGKTPMKNASSDKDDAFGRAFDEGLLAAEKCREAILQFSEPHHKAKDWQRACIVVFVAVWTIVAWAVQGVRHSEKEAKARGANPITEVVRLWNLVRIGLMAPTPEQAEKDLAEYRRSIGEKE